MKQAELTERAGAHTLVLWSYRIALWGYVSCVILACFASPVGAFDDAIPLLDAALIQQGRTPNLDFYSFYPPFGLYVGAATFSLFGRSVFGLRAIAAVLYVCVLILTFRFFRFRFPRSQTLIPAAVLFVAATIGYTISMPFWPGFALSVIALLVYLQWISDGRSVKSGPLISGILASFALLYRVNFGGYVAIVVAIDILMQCWFERRLRNHIRDALAFAAPVLLFSAGFCLWVYGKNAGSAVSEFVFTAQKTMGLRFVEINLSPESALAVTLIPSWFAFRMLKGADKVPPRALIPAALALLSLALTIALGSHPMVAMVALLEVVMLVFLHIFVLRLGRCEFCLLLFYCGLLHYYLSRADWFHVRLLPIGAALLLPFLFFPGRESNGPVNESFVSYGTALAILAAGILVFATSPDFRPMAYQVRAGMDVVASVARHPRMSDTDRLLGPAPPGRGFRALYPDADELDALRYLRAKTSRTEPIYVGVKDHSRVFWNDLRMYWLAERPIGVRMFQLEYRVATEAPFQRQTIHELEQNHVKWIVLDCIPVHGDTTYAKSSYRGSTLVDEYIARNFRVDARFGGYEVLTAIGQ